MKLYLLETQGLNSFYVVAKDPTEAENRLKKLLEEGDFGFTSRRLVTSINLLSEEVPLFGGKPKPNFNDEYRLILPTSCEQ